MSNKEIPSLDSLKNTIENARRVIEDTAAVLTTERRNNLKDSDFAVPGKRKLPIHDCSHARNAAARLNQTKGLTSEEKRIANQRIQRKIRQCRGK